MQFAKRKNKQEKKKKRRRKDYNIIVLADYPK